MENLNIFVPIKKVDVAQRLVYGTLAAEVPDHANEIMDYETSAPNWKLWSDEIHKVTDGKSAGNVRAMHTNIAAGKLTDIAFDDATKTITGCAKIVDDNEWNKVLEGVYTGFSMGGKYAKRWTDPTNPALKRYTATVHEVSIVDLPCIPTAKFEVVKADGTSEMRKFKAVEDADADLKQVWLAKDGTTHEKKQDALQKNLDLALVAAIPTVADAMDALKKAQDALAADSLKAEDPQGDLAKKDYTDDERKDMADKGEALPDGSFPIANKQDLENAIEAYGQAKDKPEAKKHIIARAKALDAVDMLPDGWVDDKAGKAVKALLAKGMCEVGRIAFLIEEMTWLQNNLAMEAVAEGDDSAAPTAMAELISTFCGFLQGLLAEEAGELTGDPDTMKADGLTEAQVLAIRKAFGKDDLFKDFVSPKTDAATVDQAEEMKKLSTELDLEKAAKAEMEKAVGTLKAGIDDLTKGIDTLKADNAAMKADKDDMAKRLAHLEAQPMPAKGIATTVPNPRHETQESGSAESVEAIVHKYRHLPPEQARKLIQNDIKALHV